MTITRLLCGVFLALAALAQDALAQDGDPHSSPGRYALIPSVGPAEPATRTAMMPPGRPYAATVMPPSRPFATPAATALDRVTAPIQPASDEPTDPVGTLTGQPSVPPYQAMGLPPGSYPSPYFTDGPGCCGPLGRDGRIGYELYMYTGPTWALGEGEFTRRLQTGWMVGGGGRSLLFDASHTAAWVLDLGLSYQYNRGEIDDPLTVDIRRPPLRNDFTGQVIPQADVRARAVVRALHRTNFNFGIGRDWWLWGPGSTGLETGRNLRVGALIGGRWGTSHVDLEPIDVAGTPYSRRQNVTKGVFLAAHGTVEIPMGTWIWFAGLRTEWGYDWTNVIPPLNGNIHNLNLLLTAGVRF